MRMMGNTNVDQPLSQPAKGRTGGDKRLCTEAGLMIRLPETDSPILSFCNNSRKLSLSILLLQCIFVIFP